MSITLDGSNVSTVGVINSGTAQATTSGTIITFTGIPAGVKRITMMFNEVSTSGTSTPIVQIGSGSIQTTSYVSTGGEFNGSNTTATASSTAGFIIRSAGAANAISGAMRLELVGSNLWVSSHSVKTTGTSVATGGGAVSLSGTLDRIALTTVNGTDTFDAGSINILYE
jgi:hypothetical protein